jgi:hypothetical protein
MRDDTDAIVARWRRQKGRFRRGSRLACTPCAARLTKASARIFTTWLDIFAYSGASGALSAQMSEESSMTPISSGS